MRSAQALGQVSLFDGPIIIIILPGPVVVSLSLTQTKVQALQLDLSHVLLRRRTYIAAHRWTFACSSSASSLVRLMQTLRQIQQSFVYLIPPAGPLGMRLFSLAQYE